MSEEQERSADAVEEKLVELLSELADIDGPKALGFIANCLAEAVMGLIEGQQLDPSRLLKIHVHELRTITMCPLEKESD